MQDSLHHDHKPVLITTGTLLLPCYFSQLQPSLDTNEESVFKGENFTDIQTEKQRKETERARLLFLSGAFIPALYTHLCTLYYFKPFLAVRFMMLQTKMLATHPLKPSVPTYINRPVAGPPLFLPPPLIDADSSRPKTPTRAAVWRCSDPVMQPPSNSLTSLHFIIFPASDTTKCSLLPKLAGAAVKRQSKCYARLVLSSHLWDKIVSKRRCEDVKKTSATLKKTMMGNINGPGSD